MNRLQQFRANFAPGARKVSHVVIASALTLLPLAANAQAAGGGTYGLGIDGAPTAQNYLDASHLFQANLAPILTILIPFLLTMWAVWRTPGVGKKLLNMFSKPG